MNGKTQVSPFVVKHDVVGTAALVVGVVMLGGVVEVVLEDTVVDGTSIPCSGQFSEQNPHFPE